MSDNFKVLNRIVACCEQGIDAGLAVIVERQGSTPREKGAMLMLDGEGGCVGTIGGGALEQQVVEELANVMVSHAAKIQVFDLLPESFGMPCGGRIKVVLSPIGKDALPVFSALVSRLARGKATTLYAGMKEPGVVRWEISPPLQDMASWFEIPVEAVAELLIFGAGHIAQAMSPMALAADFQVSVLDDRSAFLQDVVLPEEVHAIALSSFEECMASAPAVSETTFVLIATYGHRHDMVVLKQVLDTNAGYIGMVGSLNKRDTIYARLKAEGISDATLSRIHCPVGLPIGAVTPAEIAISILAEMIAHRRKAA
ncbi:XdhC family protein [Desulfatirhabdium butyrativorans]|uniref:XdhC family protein n=1 Tax=Desulfatirhabdium butyrativorans TaxID=340467 RepID=UPI00042331E5|nr:XdhC/CoxI family protein [Desulfatirhabdium butyrativorans]